jgi:hypothetical protein
MLCPKLNINVDMMDSFTVALAMFNAVELKAKQKEAQYLRYSRVFCAARGCILKRRRASGSM